MLCIVSADERAQQILRNFCFCAFWVDDDLLRLLQWQHRNTHFVFLGYLRFFLMNFGAED